MPATPGRGLARGRPAAAAIRGGRCACLRLTPAEEAELGLSAEEAAAVSAGLKFVRLPTADFSVPALEAVRGPLAQLADGVAAGEAVVIHCRMGVGRSPLFAACVLVSLVVTPEQAWRRVESARALRVPDTEAQCEWLWTWAECWRRASLPASSPKALE